ncbi:MAG: hypothetical protein NTV82_12455, partial [Candidatus Aminicenantes bacterium]|nr:hypothetical protein [Candidatus Aminicenantes bacterium]
QKHFIFFLHGRPVGAVHIRRVKKVAIDAPGFIKDLLPFGARINPDFDGIDVELDLAGLRLGGEGRDEKVLAGGIEDLFLICREFIAGNAAQNDLILPLLEIIAVKRSSSPESGSGGRADIGRIFQIKDLAGLPGREASVT